MHVIYKNIVDAVNLGTKMLAVLIDPDKVEKDKLQLLVEKIHQSAATHIFVGGSTDPEGYTAKIVARIKSLTHLPVLLFPGDYTQITENADGILFLSLLSGRNPEYLIEQQVKSVPSLLNSEIEIIATGYILVEGGAETAVARISNTKPIPQDQIELIVHTALAGQFSGKQLIYLEAGSGALIPVNSKIVEKVKNQLIVPLIVGGGIRSKKQLDEIYEAGADMVVVGTAFEENTNFFNELGI